MKRDIFNKIRIEIPENVLLVIGSLFAAIGCLGIISMNNPLFAEFVKLLATGSVEKRSAFWHYFSTLSPVLIWPIAIVAVPLLTTAFFAGRRLSRFRATNDDLRQWKIRMSSPKYSTF